MAFENIKNNFQRQKYLKLLVMVAAASALPNGCSMVPEKDADALVAADGTLFMVNKSLKDAKGNVAVRTSDAGTAAALAISAAKAAQPAAPEAPKAASMKFELQDNVPMPESKRGGAKADLYPFAQLAVGQSFFVPATEKRPDPAKSLASTVSAGSRRYAATDKAGNPTGKDGRKFTIRARTQAEHGEVGARIWRTK